jgi:hypothetical protein
VPTAIAAATSTTDTTVTAFSASAEPPSVSCVAHDIAKITVTAAGPTRPVPKIGGRP